MDDFDARTTALDRAVGAGAERALDSFRGTLAVETKDGPLDEIGRASCRERV